ncbi:hypothetical protein ACHAXS_008278 [Conticribra weissflogii]
MRGPFPKSLYRLKTIIQLLLNDNSFTGTISTAIEDLKRLNRLTLNNNDFSGTLPSELGLCENLARLRIHGTSIKGTVPTEVCDLRSKNLFSINDYIEIFSADCLSGNDGEGPFIFCECCSTCCDHDSAECIIVQT